MAWIFIQGGHVGLWTIDANFTEISHCTSEKYIPLQLTPIHGAGGVCGEDGNHSEENDNQENTIETSNIDPNSD